MLPQVAVPYNFWKELVAIDEQIAAAVAARGCPRCGGRLHRGDYARKPRGGVIAELADGEARRISLCCDREGCPKRALPPSGPRPRGQGDGGARLVVPGVRA